MKRLSTLLVSGFMAAAMLFPATPAFAEDDPCKGQAPGPHCRPSCFYTVVVHPGDPAGGEAPWVEIVEPFC